MLSWHRYGRAWACAGLVCLIASGCTSFGPPALYRNRLHYNEVIKASAEEELLLNIVRLRYTDTPSSLQVSAIAAQFERTQSVGIVPFFTASGADVNRSFTAVLPQFQASGADRPTFSLTPQDDQEFTRKLFTPMSLDGIVYLAKTTWPIATVFRLYLENLNWVPNAQMASGPTPAQAPPFADFQRGMQALQELQRRGQIVFGTESRDEKLGGPLPAARVTAADLIESAKNGFEYRLDEKSATWSLYKKVQQPVLRIDPAAVNSAEMSTLARVFRLKPGLTQYDITSELLNPFPSTYPAEGVTSIDLETRSLLQALFYVSHGIEVPAEHAAQGFVAVTRDEAGAEFNWQQLTRDLFRVHSVRSQERPPTAVIAVPYRGYWFYIDGADHHTKSTFSLLLELSRLELAGKTGASPLLTLPVTGR